MVLPFAVLPFVIVGLRGVGPNPVDGVGSGCENAIFLFPEEVTEGILDVFGAHVLSTFSDRALAERSVVAVGGIHQEASDVTPGHSHFPKSVPHYWQGYTAEIARKEPHPRTLVQYVRAAQAIIRDTRNLQPGVEKLASGLIRLADLVGDASQVKRKSRAHRAVINVLEADPAVLELYRQLIKTFLIERKPISREGWSATQSDFLAIARAISSGPVTQGNATELIAWPKEDDFLGTEGPSPQDGPGPNVCRVSKGQRSVDLRLGSIHSVKGQTHLATLLLSTYWRGHSSKRMLPWLLGEKENGGDAKIQDTKRLLQTYVAMTRPTHMICLAIPRETLGETRPLSQDIAALRQRGWRVAEVVDRKAVWHP